MIKTRLSLLHRLLLLLLILMAFALRIYRLDVQSLWYDEGVTASVAQLGFVDLTRWTARDIQPPLYYYVVAAWGNLTDWREWHLRWPSVWFGVLTVPLMTVLAGRIAGRKNSHSKNSRSRSALSQSTPLLIAFLAALHPLLIYYSQEARMYAMLTTLVILCAVLLMGQIERASLRGWMAFVLAATAAVYTHYFAFFLLLAIGLAYLLIYKKEADLRSFLLANFAILVLYIPWFGALFTRLAVDSSYLPGQVKLIELVRHTLITFIAGETILETRADPALLSFAVVTIVSIAWLGWRAANGVRPLSQALILGLCWTIIPCVLILLLTLYVPKFNARYVMIALPGLLLLWSVAAADMMARRSAVSYLAAASMLLLTVNFGGSIGRWFDDEAFTKAQWREVAHYVRDHKMDGEAVILVSGHAWPVWDYYAPDMPPVRLPDLEILDVNAVLDYRQSGSVLRDELVDQQGAWLVRWQDQFVDPMETAALHLEEAATHVPVNAEFWHVQVDHFTSLRSDQIDPQPPLSGQESVNFGNRLVLLGSRVNERSDLLLYWSLHEKFAAGGTARGSLPDYRMAAELRTDAGLSFHRLRDRRLVAYAFPTMRWLPDQINVSRIPVRDWAGLGALPNQYQLVLSVYDAEDKAATLDILDPNGTPLGKQTFLSLPLTQTVFEADGPLLSSDHLDAVHLDAAYLDAAPSAKVKLSTATAEPGEPIIADVQWVLEQPLSRTATLEIQWIGEETTYTQPLQPFAPSDGFTALDESAQLPSSSSSEKPLVASTFLPVHTVHELRVPPRSLPGAYKVLFLLDSVEVLREDFSILASTRSFEPPALIQSIGVTFGNEIELLGVVDRTPAADGKSSLTLAWRAVDRPRIDYFSTVQILNAQGQPVVQSDLALPRGSSSWLVGQVETQTFLLDTPTLDDPRFIVAVYDARAGFQRLLLPSGADHVELR